jgi:hypothetical protein
MRWHQTSQLHVLSLLIPHFASSKICMEQSMLYYLFLELPYTWYMNAYAHKHVYNLKNYLVYCIYWKLVFLISEQYYHLLA